MIKQLSKAACCLMLSALLTSESSAQTCSADPNSLSPGQQSMDRYFAYMMCSQPIIDEFWYTFGFYGRYWDDGFGYHAVCDSRRPLGRTMGALFLLKNSYLPRATSLSDWEGDAVRWAYPYSGTVYNNLDDFRAGCYSGEALALTTYGPFRDDRIDFFLPIFYSVPTVMRSAGVLHEAHHYGAKVEHTCDSTRDRRWEEGLTNMTTAYYLMSYYTNANVHTNRDWKLFAADYADAFIEQFFCEPPPLWVQEFRSR